MPSNGVRTEVYFPVYYLAADGCSCMPMFIGPRQLTEEVAVQVFVTCVPTFDIHYGLTSDRDDMYVIFPGDRGLIGILDIHSWTQRSRCLDE